MSRREQFADFFALKHNIVVLLVAIFVIGMGEELWMRFVPKYLQALGAGVFVIGLYDALRTMLSAIYAYPGGVLVDRWGHRRSFIAFTIFSMIGYAMVLLIPHWAGVIAGMFLFLSWTCFSLPAAFSLVGATLASNRHSMGIGLQMVIKRIPIMVAPFFGGLLIDRFDVVPGVRIGLIICILLSGVAILVERRLRDEPKEPVAPLENWNFWRSLRGFNAPLRQLLLSDILVRFCERIPFAWVVIFAMDFIGMSGTEIGVLIAIEMVFATLCILPTSYFADRTRREPFVIATFIMFTLFPVMLLFVHNFSMLAVAFAIRGLKEFGDTSRKALIIGYCEPERRGQMIGAYYLVRDLIVSLGALVGAYLWYQGPRINFLGATAFGIAGTIFYIKTLREERRASLDHMKKELASRARSK